jgi:arylsulfatase
MGGKGTTINGTERHVQLDGYNMIPYFSVESESSPRLEYLYFDQSGNLKAVRVGDFKIHFALLNGNISNAVRDAPAWPKVVHLKADPYEKALEESGMYLNWYATNTMWTFVPVQRVIKELFETFEEYPLHGRLWPDGFEPGLQHAQAAKRSRPRTWLTWSVSGRRSCL